MNSLRKNLDHIYQKEETSLLMDDYQYCESKDGEITYADTDCWYLLDLPMCKPDVAAIKKDRKKFFREKLECLEVKNFDFSGLYLLIDSNKNEIYVGESSDVKTRANNHPEIEFDKMILLWDGRPNTTSHFGNETFRKTLEKECIKLFKHSSSYKCINDTENPKKMDVNIIIKSSVDRFSDELKFLLNKYGLIGNKLDNQT